MYIQPDEQANCICICCMSQVYLHGPMPVTCNIFGSSLPLIAISVNHFSCRVWKPHVLTPIYALMLFHASNYVSRWVIFAHSMVECCQDTLYYSKLLPSINVCVHGNSFKETRQSKQLCPKTTPFFLKRKMSCLGRDLNLRRSVC